MRIHRLTYLFNLLPYTTFDHNSRKQLPWQQNKNPYRVWISEIMLQQTQVTTVIPYYERFMARFPDLQALARAREEEVLTLWSGLGYYRRAKHLYRAAQVIVTSYAGNFPEELAQIEQLPGIGRSTAGAIFALGFGKKAAILDGNVKRVLTRLHAITESPDDRKINAALWDLANHYTPAHRIGDFTQAMMDLGALLCLRGSPRCDACPFISVCQARLLGIEKDLPKPKPKRLRPIKTVTFLICRHKNRFLLEKQPDSGIWPGLWSFPHLKGLQTEESIRIACQQLACTIKTLTVGERFRHTFTHFHLDIEPIYLDIQQHKTCSSPYLWYTMAAMRKIGLPAPVSLLLKMSQL